MALRAELCFETHVVSTISLREIVETTCVSEECSAADSTADSIRIEATLLSIQQKLKVFDCLSSHQVPRLIVSFYFEFPQRQLFSAIDIFFRV